MQFQSLKNKPCIKQVPVLYISCMKHPPYFIQGVVYPIEVKAGKAGKLKSLHLFLKEKKAPFGIKISQDPLKWNHEILSIPFYLTSHLPRLIDSMALRDL